MSGLRERKKQQTLEALSWAALRLAVERGFDRVLVDDVASAAGVSPRTFNNYFSSKAEAIVWRHLHRARQAADLIRARPDGEPLWESITAAVVAQANEQQPDPQWTAGVRLMLTEPAIVGEFLKASVVAEREIAVAVAERAGKEPTDMYPRLVAAAIGAANQTAMELWLDADPPVSLGRLLRDALKQIAAGLPDPSA